MRMALDAEGIELHEGQLLGYVCMDSDKSHKTADVFACCDELKLRPLIMCGKGGIFLDPLDRKIYGILKAKLKASEQDDVRDWHVDYFCRILAARWDLSLPEPKPNILETGMAALDSSIVRLLQIWNSSISAELIRSAFHKCYTFMEPDLDA